MKFVNFIIFGIIIPFAFVLIVVYCAYTGWIMGVSVAASSLAAYTANVYMQRWRNE